MGRAAGRLTRSRPQLVPRRTRRRSSASTWSTNERAAQAFLRASGSSYPHIFDPDAQQLLKFNGILPVQAIPSTTVIDKKGRVAARVIGPVSAQTLTELVDEVASST